MATKTYPLPSELKKDLRHCADTINKMIALINDAEKVAKLAIESEVEGSVEGANADADAIYLQIATMRDTVATRLQELDINWPWYITFKCPVYEFDLVHIDAVVDGGDTRIQFTAKDSAGGGSHPNPWAYLAVNDIVYVETLLVLEATYAGVQKATMPVRSVGTDGSSNHYVMFDEGRGADDTEPGYHLPTNDTNGGGLPLRKFVLRKIFDASI